MYDMGKHQSQGTIPIHYKFKSRRAVDYSIQDYVQPIPQGQLLEPILEEDSKFDPNNAKRDTEEMYGNEKILLALKNHEIYHRLKPGSAKFDKVKVSSVGIEGWAKWQPPAFAVKEY